MCAVAIVAAGCGDTGSTERASVVVPDLVGMPQPDAQKELERLGLRWRFGGDDHVLTEAPRPLPPNVRVSPDPYDDQVVSQIPEAGQRVTADKVIVLETRCTMLRFETSGCI